MLTIGVFFGGVSCEHDISVITGLQVAAALSMQQYRVVPILIAEDGRWLSGESLLSMRTYRENVFQSRDIYEVMLLTGSAVLCRVKRNKLHELYELDCAVLCNHGVNGEDGSLQGLLQLHRLPYTGSGVYSSACCMDKALTKQLFTLAQVPQVEYLVGRSEKRRDMVQRIEREIGYPVMIKPANLGSSIGIGKADSRESLMFALEVGFSYDNKIVAEHALTHFTEINCACMRNAGELVLSELEKPVSWHEFLTFEDKYVGRKEAKGGIHEVDIPREIVEQVQSLTKHVYTLLECSGVVRVDFLVSQDNVVYVNELNTIPGSMAWYLFSREIAFPKLLESMIDEAMHAFAVKEKLTLTYRSTILHGKTE